jgi:hypothetical protein
MTATSNFEFVGFISGQVDQASGRVFSYFSQPHSLLQSVATTSFERTIVDIQSLLSELKTERNRLGQAISALQGLASASSPRRGRPPKAKQAVTAPRKKSRRMSQAARARIGAAKKAWWAKQKGKGNKKAKPVSRKSTGRKPMSAAMRKKLSAMMKARWAQRNKRAA